MEKECCEDEVQPYPNTDYKSIIITGHEKNVYFMRSVQHCYTIDLFRSITRYGY